MPYFCKRNRLIGAGLWKRQRRHTPDCLAFHSHHLAARSQNRQSGASIKKLIRQGAAGLAQVFAIVQEQKSLACGKVLAKIFQRVLRPLSSRRAQRRPYGVGQVIRVLQRREIYEYCAI